VHRRHAIALCLGAWTAAADDIPGAALLVNVRTKRVLSVHRREVAGRMLVPPGSAIKPFAIQALLEGGKLRASDSFVCPRNLQIGGRQYNCSHPIPAAPFDARTALAYSCNCFVAHFADRFAPGELAAYLTRQGLTSSTGLLGADEATGRVQRTTTREAAQLQAIGEADVLVTVAGMAMAYRRLAVDGPEVVRAGLEDAVEFGTAQQAAVKGVRVAGKTGSVRASDGSHIAWFCGFAPSRTPEVVVAVMLQGSSGGADAAPVAARILAGRR